MALVCGKFWDDDDGITWWENTAGDGSVWTEHTVDGAFYDAVSVYAADVNGDGNTDVLGASDSGSGRINWWRNYIPCPTRL